MTCSFSYKADALRQISADEMIRERKNVEKLNIYDIQEQRLNEEKILGWYDLILKVSESSLHVLVELVVVGLDLGLAVLDRVLQQL